jgi:LysM repeat protein
MNPEEVIDFDNKFCKDENLFVHKALFRPGAKPTDAEEHGEAYTSITKSTSSQRKYYRVRSGDTLSKIARQCGTSVTRICQLNGIRSSTRIHVGKTLRTK